MAAAAKEPFVHLHLHTEYSTLDGAVRIKDLMAKCARYGMPAVAMTDHGNLYGAIEFYEAAVAAGIKPIIGCEIYLAPTSMEEKKAIPGHKRSFIMEVRHRGECLILACRIHRRRVPLAFNDGLIKPDLGSDCGADPNN